VSFDFAQDERISIGMPVSTIIATTHVTADPPASRSAENVPAARCGTASNPSGSSSIGRQAVALASGNRHKGGCSGVV